MKIFEERVFPREYSVMVYTEGNNYYAKNQDGGIICSNSPTACLQEAVNYLAQLGGGRILVKRGIYYPSTSVDIPDGINLLIEGEGSSTVFRYTNQFPLFRHSPNTPTWTSEVVLRNFKIDRSGSGSNYIDVVRIDYAKFVMYDGIEIIDDLRPSDGDAGLVGYNNIVAIAKNNRVLNKSYGIWLFGHLSIVKNNYTENTAMVGIGSAGLLANYPLPRGYSPGGITIIENNVCIDCGKTDEAIAIDYQDFNPMTNGLGIVRNNRIININSTAKHAIALVSVAKAVVENNEIIGNISFRTIVFSRPGTVVIRNNFIDVNLLKEYNDFGLLFRAHGNVIFENNKITVNMGRDVPESFENIFYVYDGRVKMRNNVIDFNLAQNASISNQLIYIDRELIMESNDITFNLNNGTYKLFYVYGSAVMSKNKIKVNVQNGYVDVTSAIDFYYETPYSLITQNVIKGQLKYALALNPSLNNDMKKVIIRDNIFESPVPSKALLFILGTYSPTVYLSYYGNVTTDQMENAADLYFVSSVSPVFIIDWDTPLVTNWGTAIYRYKRRNSGNATIGAGSTRITVSHNLVTTPSKILITPLGSPPGKLWVENITATSFDIVTDTAPTADLNVAWYAET